MKPYKEIDMKTTIVQLITISFLFLSFPVMMPGQNFEGGGYQGGAYGSGGVESISGMPDPAVAPPDAIAIFPNPVNGQSTIQFTLSSSGKAEISVFDITNRQVRMVISAADMPPGEYSVNWNGSDDKGIPLAGGLYFCRMVQGSKIFWKKLILTGR